jgi:integrase
VKISPSDWAAKIQHLGRRETFSLGTPNKAAAANKAKEIYLSLQGAGWESTLAKYKPKTVVANEPVVTVGEFIEQVKATVGGKPKTVEDYCRAFRTIVADIFDIDGGKKKYDYRGGGREAWLKKIHAVKLADVTPECVQKWKLRFLRRAGENPVQQRSAKISVNSMIRQAKSLFAKSVLKFITLRLPGAKPFDDVEFEPRQSMRYRSGFSAEDLIKAAQQDLTIERLKIFLLASLAGLRRNEIDKLEWSAFRWGDNVIRIEATQYFHPKSEDSVGDVEIDPEVMTVFRGFHAKAKSNFVVESPVKARPATTYSHYRCASDLTAITDWLRAQGVPGKTPLHTLRKEFGSQICAKHGIYAASHALRHADISITSQHYLDKKRSTAAGLGHLLTVGENVVTMPAPVAGKLGRARKSAESLARMSRRSMSSS